MTQPVNFGTCWGTPGGQDVSTPSYMATGFQVVGEAVARIWTTSPKQLIDDPDYGYNLTDLIGADLSPRDLLRAQQGASVAAQRDERVLSCDVLLDLTTVGQLVATANIATANGPFKLVLTVSNVNPTTLLVLP